MDDPLSPFEDDPVGCFNMRPWRKAESAYTLLIFTILKPFCILAKKRRDDEFIYGVYHF